MTAGFGTSPTAFLSMDLLKSWELGDRRYAKVTRSWQLPVSNLVAVSSLCSDGVRSAESHFASSTESMRLKPTRVLRTILHQVRTLGLLMRVDLRGFDG